MWFTLARSNKYSPGAARLAPGVRTVSSDMGVPPLTLRVFRSLEHTLARHAAANWALSGRLVPRPKRDMGARRVQRRPGNPTSAGPGCTASGARGARLRRGGLGGALLQDEVVIDHIEGRVDLLAIGRHAGRLLDEVDDQGLLHPI